MKITEFANQQLFELGPIIAPTLSTSSSTPQMQPIQQLGAPNPTDKAANARINSAMVSKQTKDKNMQRKQIQDQITMLTKQIADLRKQLIS